MTRSFVVLCVCAAFALGMLLPRGHSAVDAAPVMNPAVGWTLHIDAERHFGGAHPMEIAHHYCKPVAAMTECQVYAGDGATAQLVAVETIVSPATYKSFSRQEQHYWHYHKVEIPKVHARLPGMTPAQAKKTVAAISDTYGKIWLLWDPLATNGLPTGQPTITVLR